ncbi:GL21214 [Drosophila persimilis]|uniref:GL21214 n=1 Tax=Drosophila persimilis TaxID=7234 RepID=B4HAS6_DROPE|nr:GL21214 [Drosophila persimilis]
MSIQNLNTRDPFADAIKGNDDDIQDGLVHIRIQQRNGRKTLTTVQGLSAEYDLKKIVRSCKKEPLQWQTRHVVVVAMRGRYYQLFSKPSSGSGGRHQSKEKQQQQQHQQHYGSGTEHNTNANVGSGTGGNRKSRAHNNS